MRGKTRSARVTALALVGACGLIAIGSATSVQGADRVRPSSPDARGWARPAAHPDAVAASARSAAARRGNRTLTVVEDYENSQQVSLPVGGPEFGPGDGYLMEAPLLNAAGSRQVGVETVRCMIGFESFTCEATLLLRGKGKIRAAGTMFGPDDYTVPVTGGTGQFRAARGQLTSTSTEDGNGLVVVELVE
jgi:hypothetical protein